MRIYIFSLSLMTMALPVLADNTPPTPPKKPFPHISWQSEDGNKSFDLGGALRTNYRYEDWKTTSNRRNGGRFVFDMFRFDVEGKYDNFYLKGNYWFYERDKRSIEYAAAGYRFNSQQSFEIGAPARPFGLMPYPQFGWSFHIPFFLGYGVNTGLGAKYSFKNSDWDVQLAYYPRSMPSHVRFAPDVATYSQLKRNAIPAVQSGQANKKKDQVNLRVVRTFKGDGWTADWGGSLTGSKLYNDITHDTGTYWAAGTHGKLNAGNWTVTSQLIRYEYKPKNPQGVSKDRILMGVNGSTPAYFIAAKASAASFNVGYDIHTPSLGYLKIIRPFNDYSYMIKDKSGWSDSQMYTAGVQFIASPIIAWVDLTWAKNSNPWGGAENATGWTSATSSGSNKWYFRTNVNIGYYF